MFAKELYRERRARLMGMVGKGIIVLPGNMELPYNYPGNTLPFRQDSTFLYYIGVDEPGMFAVLDCESGSETLFGPEYSIDDIIWTGPMPTVADLALKAGMQYSLPSADLHKCFQAFSGRPVHYVRPYQHNVAILLASLRGKPVSMLADGESLQLISSIVSMRKIKGAQELDEMEKAVNITAGMHCAAMRRVGESLHGGDAITERDVVGELYKVALSKGYYHSFPPIVTVHGEVFHNNGYREQLRKGALLLVDSGAEGQSHYAGDMTRTIPVGGKFSKRQKDIYDIVVDANMGVVKSARPGIMWRDMHNLAAKIIVSGLKDLGLMKGDTDDIVHTGAYALFFPHGLGHLVGLDVHDMENLGEDNVGYSADVKRSDIFGPNCLRYALPLEKDMVITDEPGIYFIPQLIDMWRAEGRFADFINYDLAARYKGFGGIRVEDDLHITEGGCRVMGAPVPKYSADVEDFVARWGR